MKQTLYHDQTSRKIDSLHDRLNHRMGYMENRLDAGVSKIQVTRRCIALAQEIEHKGARIGLTVDAHVRNIATPRYVCKVAAKRLLHRSALI